MTGMPQHSRGYGRWYGLAAGLQRELAEIGLDRVQASREVDGGTWSLLHTFDKFITNPSIREVSRSLFRDNYYARAVEEAFKCLNNAVKSKSRLSIDGADLMRTAFSANDPVLGLNNLSSRSEKDEQRGYMDIFAGAMTGIRNPRAHDHELNDDPKVALDLLVLANHLMDKLNVATKRNKGQRRR